ncbi:hypothetical protein C8F01DRAFT_1254457 [Mycena amicta]|nr:hypothetical protein C8F01DRAFT_1254457 [Mycena amicta]
MRFLSASCLFISLLSFTVRVSAQVNNCTDICASTLASAGTPPCNTQALKELAACQECNGLGVASTQEMVDDIINACDTGGQSVKNFSVAGLYSAGAANPTAGLGGKTGSAVLNVKALGGATGAVVVAMIASLVAVV